MVSHEVRQPGTTRARVVFHNSLIKMATQGNSAVAAALLASINKKERKEVQKSYQ